MAKTILLYGATGFSGRLIADEAAKQQQQAIGARIVLAARNRMALAEMARTHGMEARAFPLNDRDQVIRQLEGIDLVLNAAGPFSQTAARLATAALERHCHYVDLNGEMDVYQRLGDYASYATERNVCMVCSAGFMAAASSLLLEEAFSELRKRDKAMSTLGAIRVAMSSPDTFSRGSAHTMWRSLREQVAIVRDLTPAANAPTLWHSPVAKLERTVDFTPPGRGRRIGAGQAKPLESPHNRIVMAANLVDTLTARRAASRRGFSVRSIESYVQVGNAARLAYPLATLGASIFANPIARRLAGLAIGALPDGPTPQERSRERQLLLLTIEDSLQQPLIEWCVSTPNAYDFSARAALAIAQRVIRVGHVDHGWKTPGELLHAAGGSLRTSTQDGPLRGCEFVDRLAQRRKHA